MTVSKRLKKYLKDNKVAFKKFKHPVAFTTQEVAAAQHVPGHQMVKTAVVKIDDKPALAVLPAPRLVNFKKLKKLSGGKKVKLASEDELKAFFPDCELGAMTPLGPLYNLPVYADEAVIQEESILFNAESHTDTVQISGKDFQRLTRPQVGDISGV